MSTRHARERPIERTRATPTSRLDRGASLRSRRASCAYYSEALGFAIDFVYGDPVFYAQVSRDAARLALRFVHDAAFAQDIREREQLLSAEVTVATAAQIEQLYLEFRASNVRFHRPLKTEPWDAKTFIVIDPDGNLVLFAGPTEGR